MKQQRTISDDTLNQLSDGEIRLRGATERLKTIREAAQQELNTPPRPTPIAPRLGINFFPLEFCLHLNPDFVRQLK